MHYSIENVKTEQVVVTRSLTFESNQRAPLGMYVCMYVVSVQSRENVHFLMPLNQLLLMPIHRFDHPESVHLQWMSKELPGEQNHPKTCYRIWKTT